MCWEPLRNERKIVGAVINKLHISYSCGNNNNNNIFNNYTKIYQSAAERYEFLY